MQVMHFSFLKAGKVLNWNLSITMLSLLEAFSPFFPSCMISTLFKFSSVWVHSLYPPLLHVLLFRDDCLCAYELYFSHSNHNLQIWVVVQFCMVVVNGRKNLNLTSISINESLGNAAWQNLIHACFIYVDHLFICFCHHVIMGFFRWKRISFYLSPSTTILSSIVIAFDGAFWTIAVNDFLCTDIVCSLAALFLFQLLPVPSLFMLVF